MRLGTRLVLTLVGTVTSVMLIYGWIAFRQRSALLREGLIRETETLGRTMQIVADNALRDGRDGDLQRVLGRIMDDPETVLAVVVDSTGRLLAGTTSSSMTCLEAAGTVLGRGVSEGRGWLPCGDGTVRWVALPLRDPGARILLGRRETVVRMDMAASRVRISLTILILAVAASVVTLLVLRRALTQPLARIMVGVRSVGGPDSPVTVPVPRAAGELQDLARAFNEMADRLEGKRRALVREVEERLTLEDRLKKSEKFAALGRLTGGLAHELGSPLNVMAIRAEAIEGHAGVPAAVRVHAREILAEVDHIADLVRSLRHVSGGHAVVARPVHLVALVASAVSDLRDDFEHARISVSESSPPGDVVVPGDPILLRHAVTNLLRNAVQALRTKGGPRHVRVGVSPVDGRAEVVVEDDGPGIPREHRSRLFEPFFTTRGVGEGMGLGLAMCRGIAEGHGGDVSLDFGEGAGVRAVLSLPLMATSNGAGAEA
jgi:signal transduction histidine kinase